MISVYALVIKANGERLVTGAWHGEENTAPDGCLTMETRKGNAETHYWIKPIDVKPKKKEKCMCGKEKYNE